MPRKVKNYTRLIEARKALAESRNLKKEEEERIVSLGQNSEAAPSPSESESESDDDGGPRANGIAQAYTTKRCLAERKSFVEPYRKEFISKIEATEEENVNFRMEDLIRLIQTSYRNSCKECGNDSLTIMKDETQGIVVKCRRCPLQNKLKPTNFGKRKRYTEDDINLTYFCLSNDLGYKGFQKLKLLQRQKPKSTNTFTGMKDCIEKVISDKYKSCHEAVQKTIFKYYEEKRNIVPDKDVILNIDVSYMSRGYQSRIDIGCVVDIYTGLCIDFEVLSNYCRTCAMREKRLNNGKITQREFNHWKKEHRDCDKNCDSEPTDMEPEAARRLWGRSESLGFRYTSFTGHAYSNAYEAVVQMNDDEGPYEDHAVLKGHSKNLNESLHSKVWHKISKTKHYGFKLVKMNIENTISQYNFGHEAANPLPTELYKPYQDFLREKDRKNEAD